MKPWMKWLAALVATFAGAWFIATLFGVVAAQHDQKRDNAEQVAGLEAELDEVRADNAANKAAVDELNRRCAKAADCAPVPAPIPGADDAEVQDGEIQEPEIQEPELQERERQEAEKPGVDGDVGATGASCVAELGIEACRGPAGPAGADGKNGSDGKDGAPGTAQPGDYACPEGEYMTGFGIAVDGTVSLVCQPVIPGNAGGNP